jgi:hypothetical protein
MSSAESALASVARVLGVEASGLRSDTPLAPLGWDSLAAVCWQDAMAEAGWITDARTVATAATIADLTRASMTASAAI